MHLNTMAASAYSNSTGASTGGTGLRSLVCDRNGIIIAEAVYRCMICADIFEALEEMHYHYTVEHLAAELPTPTTSNCSSSSSIYSPVVSTVSEDYEEDPKFEMAVAAEAMASAYSSSYDPYDPLLVVNGNKTVKKKKKKSVILSGKTVFETPLVDPVVKEANLKAAASANEPQAAGASNSKIQMIGKGGFVTCEVCDLTRFYSHISRRYGVFSCESCAKFFYRYSQKPVQYACATGTGRCPLNITLPGARCKACLLEACFRKYILDPKKHPKIFTNSGQAAIFSPLNVLVAGDGEGENGGNGDSEVNNNNNDQSPNSEDQKDTEVEQNSLLKQQLSQNHHHQPRESSPGTTSSSSGETSGLVLNSSTLKSKNAASNSMLFTALKSGEKRTTTSTSTALPFSAEVLSNSKKRKTTATTTTTINELTTTTLTNKPSANKQQCRR